MVVNKVTLTAGSPSVTMTINDQPRTFCEPFQLVIESEEISYRVAPLLKNYAKPGTPATPEWAPNMNGIYSLLRLEKADHSEQGKGKTEPLTPEEAVELTTIAKKMGKGDLFPLDEFDRPNENRSTAIAVGLFLEPRIPIAVNHYTEGQCVVAADEIEKALDQQREIPSISRV